MTQAQFMHMTERHDRRDLGQQHHPTYGRALDVAHRKKARLHHSPLAQQELGGESEAVCNWFGSPLGHISCTCLDDSGHDDRSPEIGFC
jgi:hypothetical protein